MGEKLELHLYCGERRIHDAGDVEIQETDGRTVTDYRQKSYCVTVEGPMVWIDADE